MKSLFNYCQSVGAGRAWVGEGGGTDHTQRPLSVSVTDFKSIVRVLGALRNYLELHSGSLPVARVRLVTVVLVQCVQAPGRQLGGWAQYTLCCYWSGPSLP